ncbi:MAG: putative toxin-antitoxin system toxin component, PIN family [Gemmatimonadales bacterium]
MSGIVVDYLCRIGDNRAIQFLWRPILRDPKDEIVLELAVAAGCRYIVTFNLRSFARAAQFELDVMTPREFLLVVGG